MALAGKVLPSIKISTSSLLRTSLSSKASDILFNLSLFFEREGHVAVPFHHVERGCKLGIWVRNRKNDYWRGKLSSEKQLILEAFKGWV